MRVAIDARAVEPKLQGIGRHVLNLLLGLSARESDLEFLVLYRNPLARKLVERSGGPYRSRFQWIRSSSTPGTVFEKAEIPWLLKIHKADLFHDVGTTGVWTADIPSILTVHELAALRFGGKPTRQSLKRMFRKARLIVSVSESVADEIETQFNISRPKIRVIANALDPWYAEHVAEQEVQALRERFRLNGPFFLCVSSEKPSKNFELIKKASESWSGPEQWVCTRGGESSGNLKFLGVVEDVWLRPLYSACSALIVPSLYEGFSLPPIECLSIGNFPVVSDIPAHREVLNDVLPSSAFFDPEDVSSLKRALTAVSEGGAPMLSAVTEKFRAVSGRYSFKEKAEQLQNVYREALRG